MQSKDLPEWVRAPSGCHVDRQPPVVSPGAHNARYVKLSRMNALDNAPSDVPDPPPCPRCPTCPATARGSSPGLLALSRWWRASAMSPHFWIPSQLELDGGQAAPETGGARVRCRRTFGSPSRRPRRTRCAPRGPSSATRRQGDPLSEVPPPLRSVTYLCPTTILPKR